MSYLTKKDLKNRSVTPDIIRCFSLFCVVGIHFFQRIKYYSITLNTPRRLVLTLLRNIFIIAVPMFITLTGYLMKNKKFNATYYTKIVRTLVIYVITTFIAELFCAQRDNFEFTLSAFVTKLLDFSIGYSWYIEMYIGLFIIIPFLNLIFNNLNKKQRQFLLLICIFFSSIIPLVNTNYHFLPDWWVVEYPIVYYFMGAYLSEYPLKLNKFLQLTATIIIFTLFGLYNFYMSFGRDFIWGYWQGYNGLPLIIQTFFIFNLLLSFDYKFIGSIGKKAFAVMSDRCLGAYLLSFIFDRQFYKPLRDTVSNPLLRLNYFPLMTLKVYICAILSSILLNVILSFADKMIKYSFSCISKSV